MNSTCLTAFKHFFHSVFSLFCFLAQIFLSSDHNFTWLYFFPLRLKGKLNLFEEMFKLIIMLNALIILFSELIIEKLKIFDNFLFISILLLKCDNVFEHIYRFYFKRSFVLEALILWLFLLRLTLDLLIALTSFFVLINCLENDVLRLLLESRGQTYTVLHRTHLNIGNQLENNILLCKIS